MSSSQSATQPQEFALPPPNVPAQRSRTHWPIANPLASHPVLLIQCLSLILALITAAECHAVVTHTAPQAPKLPSILYGLALWYWWGLGATAVWKFAENSGKNFFSFASAVKHACFGICLADVHLLLLQYTVRWLTAQWPLLGPAGYSSLDYLNLNRFCLELLLYGFIFGIAGAIHLQFASQRDAMRALSLEKQLSVAHLRALQMQIEPHFLFNTLNAITSLVESDRGEQALQTLGHLNSILKSTLRQSTPEKVRLAQELELVDDYLSIEETRFADRLQVDMSIDPNALDGWVPCFLLQPMIENAIRHGISQCEESGIVQITAGRRESRLELRVQNSGPASCAPSQPGHGIGLKNTQERLSHFYGENFKFRAGVSESGGFEVLIDIPYERGDL